MGIKCLAYVWKKSKAQGSDLLMMLTIANSANDDDGLCWPSTDFLAQQMRYKNRTTVSNRCKRCMDIYNTELYFYERPGTTNFYVLADYRISRGLRPFPDESEIKDCDRLRIKPAAIDDITMKKWLRRNRKSNRGITKRLHPIEGGVSPNGYRGVSLIGYRGVSLNGYRGCHQTVTGGVTKQLHEPEENHEKEPEEESRTTTRTTSPPAAPSSGGGEKNIPSIYELFESEKFGKVTPLIKDDLVDLTDEFGDEYMHRALKIAIDANKRNLSYVKGILKKWRTDGKPSLEKTSTTNGSAKVDYSGWETTDIDEWLEQRQKIREAEKVNEHTLTHHWNAVLNQLEMQLDRANYDMFLRDTWLHDVIKHDDKIATLIIATTNANAKYMIENRLYRGVCRVARDVIGNNAVEVQFVLKEQKAVMS